MGKGENVKGEVKEWRRLGGSCQGFEDLGFRGGVLGGFGA